MAVHSLGRFDFVAFHGVQDRGQPPDLLQEELVPITRPGVDGTAFVFTGKKARPFQMRSGVDVLNAKDVRKLLRGYYLLKGDGAQSIVWNDLDFASEYDVRYVVLDVQILSVRRISAAAGGLNSDPQFWVEALWTLNPVPLSDAQPPDPPS